MNPVRDDIAGILGELYRKDFLMGELLVIKRYGNNISYL